MTSSSLILGWQIHHQEQLLFRTKSGSPRIRLKFYHYPNYRQKVEINQFPSKCKLKVKGNNSFFLYNQKLHSKGTISLERKITVVPNPTTISLRENWGKIPEISSSLQRKYQEGSKYWPLTSSGLSEISEQAWFSEDNLSLWVRAAYHYIQSKIKHREPQEERLGALQTFHTEIGDCDEFTDLFITFARMRRIPSRRLTGFYIDQQGAFVEPHAWGEFYSPKVGWIPIDIALNNLGNHSFKYVILKIEEFNPALSNYQIQTKNTSAVRYKWELPQPLIIPVY